jgi:hypothetical protein
LGISKRGNEYANFKNVRIKAKLTIILLGTTFLTLLFSSFFFIIKNTQTFKINLVNNLSTLAGIMGANSRPALEFGNPITEKYPILCQRRTSNPFCGAI